jgi:hypothetical protein
MGGGGLLFVMIAIFILMRSIKYHKGRAGKYCRCLIGNFTSLTKAFLLKNGPGDLINILSWLLRVVPAFSEEYKIIAVFESLRGIFLEIT